MTESKFPPAWGIYVLCVVFWIIGLLGGFVIWGIWC